MTSRDSIPSLTTDATRMREPGWIRLGRAFEPRGDSDWMRTHAALPATLRMRNGLHRVYFSTRDEHSRARIGWLKLNLDIAGENPAAAWPLCEVVAAAAASVSAAPVVDLGPLGAFDDSGVTVGCVVEHAGVVHLYYTGWSLGRTVPFYYAVGLAVSDDDGTTFKKVSSAPILDRSDVDPYLVASPCVLIEGGVWRMWYVSGVRWEMHDNAPRHYYHIRYAESRDGLHWTRTGRVCIDFASSNEYAIARPTVIRDGRLYRMWYSCRGQAYRLGYAESPDGVTWTRRDDRAGLDVSAEGWDSEMICYPHVFEHAGRRYMLYNGNGYGRTGFGLAVQAAPAG